MTTNYTTHVVTSNDIPHDWDFSGVKYFSLNCFTKSSTTAFVVVEDKVSYVTRYAMTVEGEHVEYQEECKKVAGIAEIGVFYGKITMMYISVREEFKGQGFGKVIYDMIIKFMKETHPGEILHRTSPSAFAPNFFKKVVDKWLDDVGVPWYQEESLY